MADGTVEAIFPYSYQAGDGRTIAFNTGDRFTLLNKTNTDWWQVRKGFEKPMYVPATYMKEIVQRGTDPIYENVENFDNYRPCNGEASGENDSDSRVEGHNSIGESTAIPNDVNRFDYQDYDEGTENTDENSTEVSGSLSEFNDDTNGSSRSSVKSLAKSLESVSVLWCDNVHSKCPISFVCNVIVSRKASLFVIVFDKTTISIAKGYKSIPLVCVIGL